MADLVLTEWRLAAETKEWVGPITATADGEPVTTFECTVAMQGVRPTTWEPTTVLDIGTEQAGVMVGVGTPFPLQYGRKYVIWVRFSDSPEVPVYKVGTIRVY